MSNQGLPAPGAGPEPPKVAPWDNRIFVALRTRAHPRPLEVLMKWFSMTGNWGLFWVILAAAIFFVMRLGGGETEGGVPHGQKALVLTIMFVYPTLIVNFIVKVIVGRERPPADDPRLTPLVRVPSSKSFPSSHAAMSFAAAAAMSIAIPSFTPVFYLLALVMSWTRVYLGVHYPSDVLAGMSVGLVCSFLWWVGLSRWILD